MIKEDIDLVKPEVDRLVDILIDSIVFGPLKSEDQIKAIWASISERSKEMALS